MLLMYVNGMGFVMDFELSGPELMYTSVVAQAQQFDTRSQIRHIMISNDIDVHKVYGMTLGEVVTK